MLRRREGRVRKELGCLDGREGDRTTGQVTKSRHALPHPCTGLCDVACDNVVAGAAKRVGLYDADQQFKFKEETPADEETRRRFAPRPGEAMGASDPSAGFCVDGHRENFAEFLAAIDEGREPLVDGAEARKAV